MRFVPSLLLAALGSVGCDHEGLTTTTTYIVRNAALTETVAECLADVAPHVPYKLYVQEGGRAPNYGDFIAVTVSESIDHGADAEEPAGRAYSDKGFILIHADTVEGPEGYFKATVCHEIGHTLGLRHSDCPGGLMDPEGSVSTVGECEINRLREIYN